MGLTTFIIVMVVILVVLGLSGFAIWYFLLRDTSDDSIPLEPIVVPEPVPGEKLGQILMFVSSSQTFERGYLIVRENNRVQWQPIEISPAQGEASDFDINQVSRKFTGSGTNGKFFPTQITIRGKVLDFDGENFVLVDPASSSSSDYFNWIYLEKDRVGDRYNKLLIWRNGLDISEVKNEDYFLGSLVPLGKLDIVVPFEYNVTVLRNSASFVGFIEPN